MALRDFLSEKQKNEQYLNDILASRGKGINSELFKTKNNIEAGRNQALGGGLSDVLGSVGSTYGLPQGGADASAIRRRLGSNLNLNLAQTARGLNNQNASLGLDQKLALAGNARNERLAAEDYSTAAMNQGINQQNQAYNTNLNIDQARKRADMGDSFAQQGIALQNQFTPQSDYQSALMRILTGLPVQIGTAYLLNKGMNKGMAGKPGAPNSQTPAPVASQTPYGPQQQTYGPYNPYSGGR